jgi:hypothetical protein
MILVLKTNTIDLNYLNVVHITLSTDTMLSYWMAASNELCKISWHKLPGGTGENLDRPQPGSNQIQYHLNETCSVQTQPNFIIMTADKIN